MKWNKPLRYAMNVVLAFLVGLIMNVLLNLFLKGSIDWGRSMFVALSIAIVVPLVTMRQKH